MIVVEPSVEQAEQPVNLGRELARKASEGREQKDCLSRRPFNAIINQSSEQDNKYSITIKKYSMLN